MKIKKKNYQEESRVETYNYNICLWESFTNEKISRKV